MTKLLSRRLRGLAERAGSGEAGLARLARIGLREMTLVIFLCLAAGSIWVFFEIADDMAEGELEAFDTAILLALRTPGNPQDPIGPPWLAEGVRDVTALGGNVITIFVTLASVGYLGLRRKIGRASWRERVW